jgi:hypothetical protein
MRFAQRVFLIAGIYGIVGLLPQYFLEAKISHDYPPVITHPEFYYGFIGVALAWQVLFLILSRDPIRHRAIMLPAAMEKLAFGSAAIILILQQRTPMPLLFFAAIDLLLALLFIICYFKTATDQ